MADLWSGVRKAKKNGVKRDRAMDLKELLKSWEDITMLCFADVYRLNAYDKHLVSKFFSWVQSDILSLHNAFRSYWVKPY